ncbi:MAG TPA: ATP-dependent helicase [Candidatus Limnocylindrales bacterium]|nr:ATP-dependent helicase [Candidatus Limnocylindrales bacterium]
MPTTPAQRAVAEQQQFDAAQDAAPQIRLIAGPGTGKSRTIEKRVAHILSQGANPANVYVISFTRATCEELKGRIRNHCAGLNPPINAEQVTVRTMHSLALRILRMGNQLNQYPSEPTMLDNWEQEHIYDAELSRDLHCAPGRAADVRLAHDAQWQTLNPAFVNQSQITQAEITGFNAFHATRTNLYSCVLPGEVIFKCVTALQLGALQQAALPQIDHLIVDEFQDLNACDQEFIRLLSAQGSILFIAGDDDQSIYSFRHADPNGIIQFPQNYPQSVTHTLTDCFRCAPAILTPASRLIAQNPNRVPKNLNALYGNAVPPVPGTLHVWSFLNADEEARAIATSCQQLINAGMAGRENEILILISNRRIQLEIISRELGNLGIPFDEPVDGGLADDPSIRGVLCLLRLIEEREENTDDYPAYTSLVSLSSGVGPETVKRLGDLCVANNQNYRALFHAQATPHWLTGRPRTVVANITNLVQQLAGWALTDTLAARSADILASVTQVIFTSPGNALTFQTTWNALVGGLPPQMTLNELLLLLRAGTESDRESVLNIVNTRLEPLNIANPQPAAQRIRILTMHGAKGLSGKVVFIPSVEQGILPSFRNLQAPGLLIEHRRLFYVSLTRAMAACVLTHAALHSNAQAFAILTRPQVRLARSQFLNEMGVATVNRMAGLTPVEAAAIVADIQNL